VRALLVLMLVSSTAVADTTPEPTPGLKSERTALILSAGGTALSSTLLVGSLLLIPFSKEGEANRPLLYAGLGTSIFSPSLGQIYAGQYLTIGMGIRAISIGIAAYGITRKQDQPCDSDPRTTCQTTTGTGLTIVSLAAIAYIGGMAWDVRYVDEAVARANRKRSKRGAMVAPTLNGVAVAGYF
jgi:hypothetical protein